MHSFLCSSIESSMISAIASLSDGGYSFSWDVLKVVFPCESLVVPMVNRCVLFGFQ